MNNQSGRQDNRYMRRHPSREEVTKFVKATMDNTYLPIMRSYAFNAAKEALTIMQTMLTEYGILTQEQCADFVKNCVTEFDRKQQEEQKIGTDAETSGD